MINDHVSYSSCGQCKPSPIHLFNYFHDHKIFPVFHDGILHWSPKTLEEVQNRQPTAYKLKSQINKHNRKYLTILNRKIKNQSANAKDNHSNEQKIMKTKKMKQINLNKKKLINPILKMVIKLKEKKIARKKNIVTLYT